MESGTRRPTRFTLAPGDFAFVVRANGAREIFIPEPKTESEILSQSHVILSLFAVAFDDPRLHDLLGEIYKERSAPPDAPSRQTP
jgi:hypothetical protein